MSENKEKKKPNLKAYLDSLNSWNDKILSDQEYMNEEDAPHMESHDEKPLAVLEMSFEQVDRDFDFVAIERAVGVVRMQNMDAFNIYTNGSGGDDNSDISKMLFENESGQVFLIELEVYMGEYCDENYDADAKIKVTTGKKADMLDYGVQTIQEAKDAVVLSKLSELLSSVKGYLNPQANKGVFTQKLDSVLEAMRTALGDSDFMRPEAPHPELKLSRPRSKKSTP